MVNLALHHVAFGMAPGLCDLQALRATGSVSHKFLDLLLFSVIPVSCTQIRVSYLPVVLGRLGGHLRYGREDW